MEKINIKFFLLIIFMLFLTTISSEGKKHTIHTIGDSTVSNWDSISYYPKTGWGQVFKYFFNPDSVLIDNTAVSGASSKTFYNKFWTTTKKTIDVGDFVLIQFGINDTNTNPAIGTDPQTTFKDYLTSYVNETRAKGAYPVLITPQIWNNFEKGTWGLFPEAIRQLAITLNVPLIDLDEMSKSLIKSVGSDYATNFIYMNLVAGEYTQYTEGSKDNTHLQEMGAIEIAKLVVAGIRNLSSDQYVQKLIPLLSPTYKITFTTNNPALGIITRSGYFPEGITVTAKAIPFKGAKFNDWSGDITGSKAIFSFIMGNVDKKIKANFKDSL